jgi:hypothetical protein
MAEPTAPGPPRRVVPGGPPAAPAPGQGPLVTEGMHAHRRDVERRRREWRREQEMLQEEAREGWGRVWKTVAWTLVAIGLAYGYWRIQSVYQNRWPIGFVWGALALCMGVGIGWILWYVSKSDM